MHKPAISREIPTFKGLCLILLQVPKLFGGSKHFVPNQKLIDILATAQFPIVFVPVQKWYSYGKFNFSTAAIKQLNAVLFLIWPKIFGLARNILGPVEGQGTRLKYIESWRKLSIQMLSITDKRTNVWSRDFMIWKINSGLWAVASARLWEKRVWAHYEQLLRPVFFTFLGSKFFLKTL